MFSLFKKMITTAFLALIFVSSALPAFAQRSYCWPQKECGKAKGIWGKTQPDDCLAGYHYCFPKETPVKLQVPIGGLKEVSSLVKYIPEVYKYAVAIVSITAVVMIMVGGLKYLTAHGSQQQITSAKENIFGAVIGLLLTLGSYTLLQTINPSLTQLTLPQLKMVAPESSSQWCPNTGTYQGKYKCGETYDKKTNPELPLSSGWCIGTHCDKKGNITLGCFKPSVEATTYQCINEKAGKACDNLKKQAENCLTTNKPTLSLECFGSSRYSIQKDAITATYSEGRLLIVDQYDNHYSFHEQPLALGEKIVDQKTSWGVSLCLTGMIGCQGQNKYLVDDFCNFLEDLPNDSHFFKVF